MRAPLAVVAVTLLLTAGCTGGLLGGSAGPGVRYENTTADIDEGPKGPPDRPATLNASTATAYARTFEYRRVYNRLWRSERSNVTLDCSVTNTTAVPPGYNVTVSCTGYAETRQERGGTPLILHHDWETQVFRYYVDANSTVRFERVDFV